MKLTRRRLASSLAGTAAAALAQTRPADPPAEEALKAARERIRITSQFLAAQQVPMATEPAFQFKA